MIPGIFHFVFGMKEQDKPFHIVHALAIRSCFEVNRPLKIFFHYHHEPFGPYWDAVKPLLKLVQVDPPTHIHGIPVRHYAHQADIVRLNALMDYGGIYADMDTIFVNPFPAHLFKYEFVMGRQGELGLCNALMMGSKNSLFATRWLEAHKHCFKGGAPGTPEWDNHSVFYPMHLAQKIPHAIHIEPQQSFFKHLFTKVGIHDLFEATDRDMNGVYSMHLWENKAWNQHLKPLTPEIIRNNDNTYNMIARAFLPGLSAT